MARKRAFIPPIERVRDGFAFNIGDEEKQLVARLLTELSQLLMGESGDPRLIQRSSHPHITLPTMPKPTPSTSD